MHLQNERITLLQRLSLYAGLVLFLVLSLLAALQLSDRWIQQNPYLLFLAGVAGVSLATAMIAGTVRFSAVAARLRPGIFALSVAGALVFETLTPLPITSVMLAVRRVPRSMEFFLQHHGNDNRDQWRSVYKTRGDTHTLVSFILPRPIRGRDTGLMIYMGRNPHRVHFGRFPPAVEIYRVSYGTDFFHLPLALAVYEDDKLLTAAGVIIFPHRTSLVHHAIGAQRMEIMWDEDRVRKDSGPVRVMFIKLLWGVLYAGVSAMILWFSWWTPKIRPVWEVIARYLTQRLS